ncbi:MAG: hypothetical protein Q4D55_02940 [Eubacteriales bacterium]|nr:hypothetical protein [Eubacteriales bacterium]
MLKGYFQKKTKRGRKLLAAICTLTLLLGTLVSGAAASEQDWMPDLTPGEKGSLKVTMTYTDPNMQENNVKTMAGVTVKLAKVAELATEGGSARYTLLSPYSSSGVRLEGMSASESNEAAAALAPLVPHEEVKSGVTAADGAVSFGDLTPGMYLVFQDAQANAAYRVDAISAMLISVPYPVVGAAGSSWQYAVETQPKTGLMGPHNNGSLTVTKQLVNTETGLTYNPPENTQLTFYVGLFTDPACTLRAAGTTDQPITFLNSDTSSTVFQNLATDATYYVAETDGNGKVVPSVLIDQVLFVPRFPNGQAAAITRQAPAGELTFQNTTAGLPDGYYYGGTLTITKRTVMDGMDYETKDTFYAAVFEDEALTKRSSDVLALDMNGKSQVSTSLEVSIGESETDAATYYVAETDASGKPLKNGDGLDFTISLNKEGGKVTLTPASPDEEVVITNRFTEEEPASTPTPIPTASPGSQNQGGGSGRPAEDRSSSVASPRTGDDTPLAGFILLAGAALLLGGVVTAIKGRRQDREG